ncbi:MAG: hypothetical protein JO093_01000 [Acidobacteria bacterium]|nr:hypothetical protein [Acidobacteriota bacterium]MBV9069044.1 hypothetical protein [Acidobacteriota bacterium]MBV9184160.1 hypothetical protein [Acidobacteriota bacterium]
MQPWPLAKRILFRFAVAFFVLINFPFPFDFIPIGALEPVFEKISDAPVHLAARMLHVSVDVRPNGSGDTTYNYVNLLCVFVIAIVITIIWSILDRRRLRYDKGWIAFRAYLRFVLAVAMISYGMAKVIPSQFPAPTLDRLMQRFGDASPMGLLWTFMGASVAYNIFSGAAEMLGGLLLTTRRTTLLGALVSAGAMTNIVMLNFAYDVPVKIYSTQLLIEAIVIALPDVPRLVDFFIRNRAVTPAPLPRLTQSRGLEIAGIVVRTFAVAAFLFMSVREVRENLKTYSAGNRSPLYGIWRVDDYQIDGHAVADLTRWRRVIFEIRPMMSVQLMDDVRVRLSAKMDEKNRLLVVSRRNEPQWDGRLTYQRPAPDTLMIDGALGGKNVHALCHLEPMPKFLLTTRGFHWINEYPFNR